MGIKQCSESFLSRSGAENNAAQLWLQFNADPSELPIALLGSETNATEIDTEPKRKRGRPTSTKEGPTPSERALYGKRLVKRQTSHRGELSDLDEDAATHPSSKRNRVLVKALNFSQYQNQLLMEKVVQQLSLSSLVDLVEHVKPDVLVDLIAQVVEQSEVKEN